MNYTIMYPTDLRMLDPDNDNLDVCIRCEDGRQFTIVVVTPENVKDLMKRGGHGYLKPGMPMLFVERLEDLYIRQLVEALVQDEALLRLYGCDIDV